MAVPTQTLYRIAVVLTLALAPATVACAQAGGSDRARTQAQATAPDSGEAEARKARSEARLRAEQVPILPSLPLIETESESRRRQSDEVGQRAVALVLVTLKALQAPPATLDSIATGYAAARFLTPDERAFMAKAEPSRQERAQFSWRAEGACVLLWSLSYLPDSGRPASECNVREMLNVLTTRTPEAFYAGARLRAQRELLDAADLIYRYHWATREAELNGKPMPDGLNGDVVEERHYALNWLVGYDEEWDDVSTDT
jgi:hypothetical protein